MLCNASLPAPHDLTVKHRSLRHGQSMPVLPDMGKPRSHTVRHMWRGTVQVRLAHAWTAADTETERPHHKRYYPE